MNHSITNLLINPNFLNYFFNLYLQFYLHKTYISQTYRRLEAGSSSSLTLATVSSSPGNDLASLFECPVCFDYVLPPILQCQSGHLVCANCRPKLTCCPTCRGTLGNIRNLGMEKVRNNFIRKLNKVLCR